MELDEAHDVVELVVRVAQRDHPLAGHARPDHLVVVEHHLALGAERARLGLAHVVEERGQPEDLVGGRVLDDGDRVRQHVLVAMDRVLLQRQSRQLGQELVGQSGLDQEPQPRTRAVDDEELVELHADALRRHDVQPLVQPLDRIDQRGIGLEAVAGEEPRRAQHAQRVVGERLVRRQRCAQALGGKIGGATVRVDQLGLRQRQRHRVDREVAAREVGLDVVTEHDVGLARVGDVRLGAMRRDLVVAVALPAADRAEPLALQPDGVGPWPHDRLDVVGPRVGGEVEVDLGRIAPEQEVTDTAADEVDARASRPEALGQGADLVEDRLQPLGRHGVHGTQRVLGDRYWVGG